MGELTEGSVTSSFASKIVLLIAKNKIVLFSLFKILTTRTLTMVFTTHCPQGFIPQTPCDNENGLSALVAVFEANELEEKKNSKQAPTRTTRTNKRRKLMSPDDV